MTFLATSVLGALAIGASSDASLVDDLVVGYELMHLTAARVGERRVNPTFDRQLFTAQLGVDDFTLGVILQHATRSPNTQAGSPETGLMLTAGYERLLAAWLSLDLFVRLGVTATDSGQPLYATDTDLRLKLVAFDVDGWGDLSRPWCPSAYFGVIANRFGRVQIVGGAGLWWSGLGVYGTALYALNGVEDPMEPSAEERDRAFAAARNTALTFSASYDLDLGNHDTIHFELRKNVPLKNAGNEAVGVVELRHFFE